MDYKQRINMKFCFKLQKSAKETHEMLKLVYGDAAVTRKTVYKWFERFRGGCESVEDERSGRPSTSKTQENVERVSEIIRSNRQLTIREISEDLNISYGSVQSILTTDLNMRQVTAKFVPPILTEEQKQQRLSISLELLERSASDSDFLRYIITGDETWVYGYDPETKVQGSQWKSPSAPRAKKARQSGSSIKVMLIVFFDLDGIVLAEFVPRNTTVNSEYYKGLLERLINDVCVKRPEKWASGFILHHSSAPYHTSLLVQQCLSDENITVCPHPPYSSDLAPCDFWLFPKVKAAMRGKHFESIQDIKEAVTAQLDTLTKEDFQHCFAEWQERWDKCVQSEGEYFEGD